MKDCKESCRNHRKHKGTMWSYKGMYRNLYSRDVPGLVEDAVLCGAIGRCQEPRCGAVC